MRLIGLGLLAFILAGLLIVMGKSGAFASGLSKLSGNDNQEFSDYERAPVDNFDVSGTDIFTAGFDSEAPLILSGLPSYSSQQFRLPIDARPSSGTYNLVFASSVSEGVEGALRVSINGVKRADILLDQGSKEQSATIELTAAELASGMLDVGLSLQGRGPIAECSTDDAIAAVVEIKPDSGLQLKLDKQVETTRDKLALWGGRVPVIWQESQDTASSSLALIHGARLAQKGYTVIYGTNGLDVSELSALSKEAQPAANYFLPAEYPISLTSNSANRGLRKFDRQTSWRYKYNVENLPGRTLPSAVDVRMAVGPAGDDRRYDMVVSLNDHMLFARRLPLQNERLNQSIALPAALQKSSNNLEISVASVDNDETRCGNTNPLVAELLPETKLRSGELQAADNLSQLRNRLRALGEVKLIGNARTAADAQAAAELLSHLEPRTLAFSKDAAPAEIRIVTGDIAAAIAERGNNASEWIIFTSPNRNDGVVVKQLADARGVTEAAVALLVSTKQPDEVAGNSAAGTAR